MQLTRCFVEVIVGSGVRKERLARALRLPGNRPSDHGAELGGLVIVFSVRILPPVSAYSAVFKSLSGLVAPTRVEPGCRAAFLYSDVEDGDALMLIEEWETREDFDRQFQADKLKVVVAAIELSRQAPTIRIQTVEKEEGIASIRMYPDIRQP